MIKNFFINLLHLNDWEYSDYIENPADWIWDKSYYQRRRCRITGKVQHFTTHCLGLNPPQYIGKWVTITTK